jgi:L-fucose mutarotase/ribose pyranase (RbsD/FucU family)
MATGSKRPPRRRRPEAPADTQPATPESPGVPLELFLTACQKSLARSVRSAQQSGKAENEFALGQRPVYMIDGIDMDVSAGLLVSLPRQDGGGEHVLLDFHSPAETRSRIRFRVQSTPVELLKGAKLELANLDPLGASAPVARMRAWLVDDHGHPLPGATIDLHFARAGEKTAKQLIRMKTDSGGRVDFFVEPMTNEVKVVGDRTRKKVFLRGSGRGINDDEYFVWATAEWKREWGMVAEFTPPFPPQVIPRKDEKPTMLCSEMHRLRIEQRG